MVCDNSVPDRLKSEIYRTVVQTVALYATECWPATKEVELRQGVMEMKITRYDNICNEDIRHRLGVAAMTDKLREARLRWYDHVLRADNAALCEIALNVDVPGKRSKGQPKQRCIYTLHSDLKLADIHPEKGHDRAKWRQRISKAVPPSHRTNTREVKQEVSVRYVLQLFSVEIFNRMLLFV
ncbi:hypothetical protein Y032_0026g1333 [Ancylostoma ceylanicum]|uniref:Reverse transcriptase n=1 Tax=Ancylostoma ceylanicum TaxID=53326 RepID=A0A016UV96_9BILA|nr:hypothetical protein Y032_0026g1333 [Ancylostoma ceylanicum]